MALFRPVSFLLSAAILCPIAAHSAPSTSTPHSHTPAASSHTHAAVVLDQFVTTAAPFARNQIDLAQSTTVLGGHSLRLKQQPTLGATLAGETGIRATSFGPGASRPIIRGLGGDRIRVLENSIGTLDASVTSPDHTVSVEPMLIDRVEIVRGPASLLYGSSAIGGVVNVITHRIETDVPEEPIRGGAELRFDSGARETTGGGVLDVAARLDGGRALVLHLDAFRRSAHDLRIPGFAESDRIRTEETEHAVEQDEAAPRFAHGRLPNSSLASDGAAAGVSFVSPTLHFGASHSGFNTRYGVPGHAHDSAPGEAIGTRIDLRQRRTDLQGEWHGKEGLLTGARVKLGHARYRHAEIEPDGTVATLFRTRGYEARAEFLHGDGSPWSGAAGVQASQQRFNATGEEAFLPPSRTSSQAAFLFEELAGPLLTWQFGGRMEHTRVAAEGASSRRKIQSSGSLGALWKIDPVHTLAVSVTHTERFANAQELFAHGPHAGTQSFEIGDATLDAEKSLGAEVSLRRRTGFITGALTLFANQFDGYIFEQPTGEIALEGEGGWILAQPNATDGKSTKEALPVYRYVQRDARFWGAELETVWHLHEGRDLQFDLRLAAELTRGRQGSQHLPRMPAPRLSSGLFWSHQSWSGGAEAQWYLRQRRVAVNETESRGYTSLNAHLSRSVALGSTEAEFFVRGSNLANSEARPHSSFVKELAPLARRAFSAGMRFTF